jgi:catechol 2,3-dioxygenase-like lactoylglutathione lyase family enzyme
MLSTSSIIGFIPAQDAERALAFYRDILGLSFLSDDGFAIVVKASNTIIRIVRMGKFTPVPYTILGWEVANIELVVTGLTAKGLAFERYPFIPADQVSALGVWTTPTGSKVAWFKDTEGNTLSLSKH